MAMPRKLPIEFGIPFPHGAFAVGEVTAGSRLRPVDERDSRPGDRSGHRPPPLGRRGRRRRPRCDQGHPHLVDQDRCEGSAGDAARVRRRPVPTGRVRPHDSHCLRRGQRQFPAHRLVPPRRRDEGPGPGHQAGRRQGRVMAVQPGTHEGQPDTTWGDWRLGDLAAALGRAVMIIGPAAKVAVGRARPSGLAYRLPAGVGDRRGRRDGRGAQVPSRRGRVLRALHQPAVRRRLRRRGGRAAAPGPVARRGGSAMRNIGGLHEWLAFLGARTAEEADALHWRLTKPGSTSFSRTCAPRSSSCGTRRAARCPRCCRSHAPPSPRRQACSARSAVDSTLETGRAPDEEDHHGGVVRGPMVDPSPGAVDTPSARPRRRDGRCWLACGALAALAAFACDSRLCGRSAGLVGPLACLLPASAPGACAKRAPEALDTSKLGRRRNGMRAGRGTGPPSDGRGVAREPGPLHPAYDEPRDPDPR